MPPKVLQDIEVEFDETNIAVVKDEIKRQERLKTTRKSRFVVAVGEVTNCIQAFYNQDNPEQTDHHSGACHRVEKAKVNVEVTGQDYTLLLRTLLRTQEILLKEKTNQGEKVTEADEKKRNTFEKDINEHNVDYNVSYGDILKIQGHQDRAIARLEAEKAELEHKRQLELKAAAKPPEPKTEENRTDIRTPRFIETLRPPVLQYSNTPHELDKWKRSFKSYITSSNVKMENLTIVNDVLAQLMSGEVQTAIGFDASGEINICPATSEDPNAPATTSIFERLSDAWDRRYPKLWKRNQFLETVMTEGDTFEDIQARVTETEKYADINGMSRDNWKAYQLYRALGGAPLGMKIRTEVDRLDSVQDGNMTEEDIVRAARTVHRISMNSSLAQDNASSVNKIQSRSYGQHRNNGQYRGQGQHQQPSDWKSLMGKAKIDALVKAGLCKYCTKKHEGMNTSKCRSRNTTCENCGMSAPNGHSQWACSKPKKNQAAQPSSQTPEA